MTTGAITQAMDDARRRSGIEDLRFHDLRQEATSRLFENTTLDVMEIKAITGHKTMQMLARYTHLRTERLVEKLNGEADGKEKPLAFFIEKPANPVKHTLTRPKKYTTPWGGNDEGGWLAVSRQRTCSSICPNGKPRVALYSVATWDLSLSGAVFKSLELFSVS